MSTITYVKKVSIHYVEKISECLSSSNWVFQHYLEGERVALPNNVYFVTVVSHLNYELHPKMRTYMIEKCLMTFLVQAIIVYGFMYEYKDLDHFSHAHSIFTPIKILIACLMQLNFYKELQNATKMLVYLKRIPSSRLDK